jgi:hypothetical protein
MKDRALGNARNKGKRRGRETRCDNYEEMRSKVRGEPVECSVADTERNGMSMVWSMVSNATERSRRVRQVTTLIYNSNYLSLYMHISECIAAKLPTVRQAFIIKALLSYVERFSRVAIRTIVSGYKLILLLCIL